MQKYGRSSSRFGSERIFSSSFCCFFSVVSSFFRSANARSTRVSRGESSGLDFLFLGGGAIDGSMESCPMSGTDRIGADICMEFHWLAEGKHDIA